MDEPSEQRDADSSPPFQRESQTARSASGSRGGCEATASSSDEAPPPTPSPKVEGALACHRRIPRQATSAVAYTAEPPASGDPLLGFAPVPHKQLRRNSITPDLQRKFIAHLAATGIVTAAARHIGKSMEALYKLRQRPGAEEFRAAWDAAIDRGVSRLEASALTRAIEGEERMVVSSGKVLGTETRHNEALVMFFLRNRLPQRYDAQANVGPGHPLYERIRREVEEDQRRIANHPDTIRHVRESIDRKIEGVRRQVEWEKRMAEMTKEEEAKD